MRRARGRDLPPLPLGLSSDGKQVKASKSPSQMTPQQREAARKQLIKQGLFEMTSQPPTGPQTQTQSKPSAAVRTSAKSKKAASSG